MASESVVEPSTPSTRRVPRFSPSESGRVAISAPRLVSAQTQTRPPSVRATVLNRNTSSDATHQIEGRLKFDTGVDRLLEFVADRIEVPQNVRQFTIQAITTMPMSITRVLRTVSSMFAGRYASPDIADAPDDRRAYCDQGP